MMRVLSKKIVGLALVLAVVATLNGQGLQRVAFVGPAKVREVTGTVEFNQGSEWRLVKAGQELPIGVELRAQDGASAVLQMVETGSLVRVVTGTQLRLASAAELPAFAREESAAERGEWVVRGLRGKAEVKRGLWWAKLTTGAPLKAGDKIRTGESTVVDLFLPEEQRVLRVGSLTTLKISTANIGQRLIGSVPEIIEPSPVTTVSAR